MAKVSYANLKLKTDTSVKTFDFQGTEIEVLNYLPIEDKYDLVMISLQKAKENGIYNDIKLTMFFHLNLIYMYTNVSFTENQRKDEYKLFDTLKSNGFIDKFLLAMSDEEYRELYDYISEIQSDMIAYENSFSGALVRVADTLGQNMEETMKIIDNFDPKKYQAVIDFATAANGNRPIK